jgi:hypothetical protein
MGTRFMVRRVRSDPVIVLDSRHIHSMDHVVENIASTGPALVRWTASLPGTTWMLEAHLGSFRADKPSQDGLVAVERSAGTRLVVADGVTPTRQAPSIAEMDSARYASQFVLHSIASSPDGLVPAFHAANNELVRTFSAPEYSHLLDRDRPQSAVAAADVLFDDNGQIARLSVVRAADCVVWTKSDGRWRLVTLTPMLRAEARNALDQWDETHPDAVIDERIAHETLILDADSWNVTALGRFANLRLEHVEITGTVDELLLATDGARLTGTILNHGTLDSWLAGLRTWERTAGPLHRAHSDVAVIRLKQHSRRRRPRP